MCKLEICNLKNMRPSANITLLMWVDIVGSRGSRTWSSMLALGASMVDSLLDHHAASGSHPACCRRGVPSSAVQPDRRFSRTTVLGLPADQ